MVWLAYIRKWCIALSSLITDQAQALTDIEAHLAIICASAPALKVLFKRRMPGQFSNVHASIRSNSSRHAPYRLAPEEHASGRDNTWKSRQLSQEIPLERTYQSRPDDSDVENVSLQSISTDKPLTSRYIHIAELQDHSTPRR